MPGDGDAAGAAAGRRARVALAALALALLRIAIVLLAPAFALLSFPAVDGGGRTGFAAAWLSSPPSGRAGALLRGWSGASALGSAAGLWARLAARRGAPGRCAAAHTLPTIAAAAAAAAELPVMLLLAAGGAPVALLAALMGAGLLAHSAVA